MSSCAIQKKLRLADNLFKEGSFYNAADLYEEVAQKKTNNSRVAFQLAETNRMLRDYNQANKWYSKTLNLSEKAWPEARFYNAQMLKMKGEYSKAEDEFDTFLGYKKTKNQALNTLRRRAKNEKEGIELAKKIEGKEQVSMVNTIQGLNHELQDVSPKYISDDKILMSALLPEEAVDLDVAKKDKEDYYSKLFVSENKNGVWTEEFFPDNINSFGTHTTNGIFDDNGNTIYFTRCDEDDQLNMVCDIYRSKKSGNTWNEPEKLGINKKGYNTTQPAIGLDAEGNKILYFASDRPGSKGGLDIWYANIEDNGDVNGAKNAGSTINTKWDELTPYYDINSNELYFSSEGHPSVGGLDVFKVYGNVDEWADTVSNLGFPINSSTDDLYFFLNEHSTKGYLVSNRPGTTSSRGETCCDDVFKVLMIVDKYLSVQTKDEAGNIISGVETSIFKVLGKNDFEMLSEGVSGKKPLYFMVEDDIDYKINGTKKGYWPSIETLTGNEIADASSDTIVKTLVMRPINRAIVENVYFAFDMDDIRSMYKEQMDTVIHLLSKYKNLVVMVEGHTDSKGTEDYNMDLSNRRANSAKNYIVENGIEESRVEAKGFGESQPIAPNENPDGSDNEAGRAKNRRVEFKLMDKDNKEMPIEIEYEAQDPKTND